ncbi:MAG: hypothetical protein IRZ03_12980 [Acidobacterium ailaaui]|jgi:hypothetical protein|nr:hypothetical protein [Pseudacidobacterium ailaaui]
MSTQSAVEDISTIVSRFQAWTAAQSQPETSEVRELSYEEARRPRTASAKEPKASAPKRRCTSPKKSAPVKQKTAPFKQVLAESAAIVPAGKKPAALVPRTTTLSVRMTDAEQKLLRLRAADAGLSASTYLRHCILEVDDLREQVQELIAENQQLRAQQSVLALSGLSHWLRRIFGRNTAALSLRA